MAHSQRRLSERQHRLPRKLSLTLIHQEAVIQPDQSHVFIVRALFDMNERSVARLAKQVDSRIADLRQFHIPPHGDIEAGQFAQRDARRIRQLSG
jgi:hypothetical protein